MYGAKIRKRFVPAKALPVFLLQGGHKVFNKAGWYNVSSARIHDCCSATSCRPLISLPLPYTLLLYRRHGTYVKSGCIAGRAILFNKLFYKQDNSEIYIFYTTLICINDFKKLSLQQLTN